MGVKTCNRVSCYNIMCDRHSDEHGYLCDDCFRALLNMSPDADIGEFMEDKTKDFDREESYKKFDAIFQRSN